MRTTEERLRPSRIERYQVPDANAVGAVHAREGMRTDALAQIWRERGAGRIPTIVLGGFVPDSTEQIFLLRRSLLRSGDVYCINYPRDGFSLDVLCAQLTGLVSELNARGTPPILFGVSFGAGLLLEWLRRNRLTAMDPVLAGVVLVSPVACVADVVGSMTEKPATLLGRALRPYLGDDGGSDGATERARAIFARMFEAGAQNKRALRRLMSAAEVDQLRHAVLGSIRGLTPEGARQRVAALRAMASPTTYFQPQLLPLTAAPTLVLFAEQEEAVLDAASPVLFAFENAVQAFFSEGQVHHVRARVPGSPVQHASLIFHVFDFLPALRHFYQRVRVGSFSRAA